MTFEEAWAELNHDSQRVIATIASVPREGRLAAARKIVEKAKKIAKKLSATHHPDRGGDPVKFRRIWESVECIEKWTDGFAQAMSEADRKRAERGRKGPFIEIKK